MSRGCDILNLVMKMNKAEIRVQRINSLLSIFLCQTLVKRLLCAILLAFEIDRERIAQTLGLTDRSVKRYQAMLDSEDYKLLLHMEKRTKASELDDFKEIIFQELDSGAYCTLREIAVMIEEKTGLKRSRNRIQIFLKKHGYKPLKVGFFPCEGRWGKTTDILCGNSCAADGASENG